MNYNIANINISINGLSKQEINNEMLRKFLNNNIFEYDVVVNVIFHESRDYQIERYLICDNYEQVFRYESEVFLANKDMSVCTVLGCSDMMNFMILLNHIFYSNAIRYHMIQFHSSLVQWQDHGIMFIGPSGIGNYVKLKIM